MEYKNNGIPKEIVENEESASNSTPSKNPKTISSAIKLIKKVEEVTEVVITSGSILCHCFTCGHPVCAPMSTDYLTKQGSTLETSSISAYQQKVSTKVHAQNHIFHQPELKFIVLILPTNSHTLREAFM